MSEQLEMFPKVELIQMGPLEEACEAVEEVVVGVSMTGLARMQVIFDERMRALVREAVLDFHQKLADLKRQEMDYKEMGGES